MLTEYPRYVKEPEICPLHATPAPCLYCLAPEVAEIVKETSGSSFFDGGILFQAISLDDN